MLMTQTTSVRPLKFNRNAHCKLSDSSFENIVAEKLSPMHHDGTTLPSVSIDFTSRKLPLGRRTPVAGTAAHAPRKLPSPNLFFKHNNTTLRSSPTSRQASLQRRRVTSLVRHSRKALLGDGSLRP
uniref:Uncharacterized protein n=1 Tax=Strigamia maritima TaxID=126957 RepID=T1J8D7_STRMM